MSMGGAEDDATEPTERPSTAVVLLAFVASVAATTVPILVVAAMPVAAAVVIVVAAGLAMICMTPAEPDIQRGTAQLD